MTDTTPPTTAADVGAAADRLPEPRAAASVPASHPDEYWDLGRCGWVRGPGR